MMRGINTTVRRLRRKVFEEVAALGFKADADTLCDDMEAIPYALVNDETEQYRDSVYRARAVVREQVRLAMGLALRPEDKPVHLTAGVEASNISDKYYEPPLMQVIPSACMRCEAKGYEVSNMCKGCLAHPCMEVCPKKAISLDRVTGKSIIDQDACIKCGRCATVCSYNAIIVQERPCAKACGMKAITSDENGKATIDYDKCVSCGMCLVNCPFGAISDKSQIYQVIKAIQSGEKVYAAVAPAFVGQFGPKVTPEKLRAAMKELGFADVLEVAIGADLCAKQEAEDFLKEVPEELPFMATENIMMDAVKAGGDRQELHERIRELSMEAGRNVKEKGLDNNLLELIAADPAFNLSLEELQKTMDPAKYVGRAPVQVEAYLNNVVNPMHSMRTRHTDMQTFSQHIFKYNHIYKL